ncbi:MAG: cation:proton antiporter, partial [Gemmatimonadaceae bacterium]|nr:cation:proton antiporter [Gemmatimonadaceae bacterium]
MPHEPALIATVAAGLGVAFLLGLVAARIGLPPIVGYLLAGIVVGPFTPGIVADTEIASQLAELGIILLMFGVGLHFSLRDLGAVRGVVLPGALLQTVLTGSIGAAVALWWGWGAGGAAVLGLSIGVASTVVMLKGLESRDRLDSPEGRLAVGWLVVEDIFMVFALVLLPAAAPLLRGAPDGEGVSLLPVGVALVKVVLFVALMFYVGRRLVPWLLERVATLGSRELFTLAVLAVALGVGTIASELFGVSFALGAFFAGAVISESEISHRAAEDALPMRDAFAVLFFVSVGMLFDPRVVLRHPMEIGVLVALVVLWKSALTYGLVRLLSGSSRTALMLGAALGQVAEFSFIVTALGVSLGLVGPDVQAIIVATSLISITLNAPMLSAAVHLRQRQRDKAARAVRESREMRETREMRAPSAAHRPSVASAAMQPEDDPFDFPDIAGHVVLVGYGRVGSTVAAALDAAGVTRIVVEEQERIAGGLRMHGERAIHGDATRTDVLARAGIAGARLLVVTAPEPIRARRVIEVARTLNPGLNVAVRTHNAAEQAFFEETLAENDAPGLAVYAEREAALSLAHYALRSFGQSDDEADAAVGDLRQQPTRPT